MANESTQAIEKRLSFKKLTPEKKKELLQLQNKNNEDSYVFVEKLPIYYWIVIAASLSWIAYLFYSSQNILWEDWVFWLNLGLTIVAVPALLISLAKVLPTLISKKKNGRIFTPNEFIRVKGDSIRAWNLKQIESVRFVEDDEQLEVWSGTHEERINLADSKAESDAKHVAAMFDSWKLNAKDEFVAGCDDSRLAYSSSGKMVVSLALVAFGILAAVGLSYAAKSANVSYDDDVTWKLADNIGTIDEFDKYKKKYPDGRHIAEINEKISAKLGKIKDNYVAKSKETADAEAVEVLTEILDETTKNADGKIYVKIKETRELDDEVIKSLEKNFGINIDSYESIVPASGEDFRKGKILTDSKLMFRDIAKEGAFEFVLTDAPPEKSSVLEVDYVIKSAEMFLQSLLLIDGRRTISYKPALEFDFDFVLRSGNSGKEYKTTYNVVPKEAKMEFFDSRDADNYSFDKKLFSTASENFGIYLGEKFGFRKQELQKQEE